MSNAPLPTDAQVSLWNSRNILRAEKGQGPLEYPKAVPMSFAYKQAMVDGWVPPVTASDAVPVTVSDAPPAAPEVPDLSETYVPTAVHYPTPAERFQAWLRTPGGQNASDPRMPSDRFRISVDLESRLREAFLAGGAA